jgi:hypothetical protein
MTHLTDLLRNKQDEELDVWFDNIAKYLMRNTCIFAGDAQYAIVELEFYYHSDAHPDPYVYCDEEQLTCGKWFCNGTGLDITFGEPRKDYGGILIRGMKRLNEPQSYISGPSTIFKELFSKTSKVTNKNSFFYLGEMDAEMNNTEFIRSERIGLSQKKEEDTKNYLEKEYRYITDLVVEHKFKNKENVVRNLFNGGKIDSDKALEIMGYRMAGC